ncbi:MAG: putative peptide maturation dehydrogenase [Arenimonas sp.]
MLIQRCTQLMVELDAEPRFALESLLSGGGGLDSTPRWMAYAPHLEAPIQVSLGELKALEGISSSNPSEHNDLIREYGEQTINALLNNGLLLCDEDRHTLLRERDQVVRDVAWWPPAAIAMAQGRWKDVDIGARNERGLMMSSQEMVDAFGAAPEPEYRRQENAATVALSKPKNTAFNEILSKRKTCRNFDSDKIISAEDLATMLHRVWGAIGTLELAPGAVAVKKNSPAGGGLHATEAYVLVQRAEGLQPGIYHYLSMQHALEPLAIFSRQEMRELMYRCVAGQDWFQDVPVMVVMTARFDRLFWKYRRHTKAWRVVHLDVGHLSQTMYLSAADLGLGAFVTAAINDHAIEQALGLQTLKEGAIAIVGFGPRLPVNTTLELDNLTLLDLN